MTLIIAGHNRSMFNDMVFFVGDSLLSAYNGKTHRRDRLIEIYKKIRSIPVVVWTPTFDRNDSFDGYSPAFKSNCVIAFAGSALTFGHMLNGIQEHLGQLRYTFFQQNYKIVKHCSHEAIRYSDTELWDEDIHFSQSHMPNLTADFQMEVISHVIRRALQDVSARVFDQASFEALRCELAIALYCWEKNASELFHVEIMLTDEVPKTPTFRVKKLAYTEILVLGKPIKEQAQTIFDEARHKGGEGVQAAIQRLVREHISADIECDENYIGGKLDCWTFQRARPKQWYMSVEADEM